MSRLVSAILLLCLTSMLACSPPPDEPPPPDYTEEMLGRWDVTAQGDETYPLWFELTRENETIGGRLQGRFGHALKLDSAEIAADQLAMEVEGDRYSGTYRDESWNGTGVTADGARFTWTAERAPELAPPADPQWGEPIELFNGKDLSGWLPRHPSQPNKWKAVEGTLMNEGQGSDLMTEAEFKDFKLHIEVKIPAESNSGIYLRGRYEVQVQDDYNKPPHSRYMGGIYGQVTPTENPAKVAGEWQSFDITLLGRWVTVGLNGVVMIDHQEIPGITGGALSSAEDLPGPIMLQGDHGIVTYRNIVLTPMLEQD